MTTQGSNLEVVELKFSKHCSNGEYIRSTEKGRKVSEVWKVLKKVV